MGQILAGVSLLCGVPHIGVVEARGPVRLVALRADAFVTMEASKQSPVQGLASKLVSMLIRSTLDHVECSLPVALNAQPQIRLAPTDALHAEQLKFTWLVRERDENNGGWEHSIALNGRLT